MRQMTTTLWVSIILFLVTISSVKLSALAVELPEAELWGVAAATEKAIEENNVIEENTVEEAIEEDSSANRVSVEETLTQEDSVEETPTQEDSAEETSTLEGSTEETPTQEGSIEETPVQNESTNESTESISLQDIPDAPEGLDFGGGSIITRTDAPTITLPADYGDDTFEAVKTALSYFYINAVWQRGEELYRILLSIEWDYTVLDATCTDQIQQLTGTLILPEGVTWAEGVSDQVSMAVQVGQKEIMLVSFDEFSAEPAAAFAINSSQEELEAWFADNFAELTVGYDQEGNDYSFPTDQWSFSEVDFSTPGLYYIEATASLGENYRLGRGVRLPVLRCTISIQDPLSPNINCCFPGRGEVWFPWIMTEDLEAQMDTFSVWLQEEGGEWTEVTEEVFLTGSHLVIRLRLLTYGKGYHLQVDYPGGYTNLVSFSYDEKITITGINEGRRDGSGNEITLPDNSQPIPEDTESEEEITSDAKTESENNTEIDSNSKEESKTDESGETSSDEETKSDNLTETDTLPKEEDETNIDISLKPETPSENNSEPTKPESETPSENSPETSTKPESETPSGNNTETSTKPESETSSGNDTETPTKPESETPSGNNTETSAKPEAETPSENSTEASTKPEPETQSGNNAGTAARPGGKYVIKQESYLGQETAATSDSSDITTVVKKSSDSYSPSNQETDSKSPTPATQPKEAVSGTNTPSRIFRDTAENKSGDTSEEGTSVAEKEGIEVATDSEKLVEEGEEIPRMEGETEQGVIISGRRLHTLADLGESLVVHKNEVTLILPADRLREILAGEEGLPSDALLSIEIIRPSSEAIEIKISLDGKVVTQVEDMLVSVAYALKNQKAQILIHHKQKEEVKPISYQEGIVTFRTDQSGIYTVSEYIASATEESRTKVADAALSTASREDKRAAILSSTPQKRRVTRTTLLWIAVVGILGGGWIWWKKKQAEKENPNR